MGWMMDQYSVIKRSITPAVITGKPLSMGGSLGRTTATADGAFHVIRELVPRLRASGQLEDKPTEETTVAVQGFGNAGAELAEQLDREGYRVVAVSDSCTALHAPAGLDVAEVRRGKNEEGELRAGPADAAEELDAEELLEVEVDVLVPAALEDAINETNVDRVRAASIFEVANGPVSPEADDVLADRGVPVIPDILTNAGGVTVSYFEWVQNRSGLYWSADEVASRLSERMLTETAGVWELAQDLDASVRVAAYVHALRRIGEAVDAKGSTEIFSQPTR
jgi:glutamate dehydrogenase (NADP+)